MKQNIYKAIFAVWVLLWGWFLIRELFVKDNINVYKTLLARSLEGKHSYITGDRLYEFLTRCKKDMPEGAHYRIAGLEDGSIEKRRAVYYLYPDLETDSPSYELDCQRYLLKDKSGI